MDHSRVPVLEALQAFRRRGDVVFGPPGHKQGRGVDPRVREVVGEGVFASDVLPLNGLDDRRESQGVVIQPSSSWPTPSTQSTPSSRPAAARCR